MVLSVYSKHGSQNLFFKSIKSDFLSSLIKISSSSYHTGSKFQVFIVACKAMGELDPGHLFDLVSYISCPCFMPLLVILQVY